MKTIDPGKLRSYGVIENSTQTQSTTGHPELTWARHANAWVQLIPRAGVERIVADSLYSDTTHVIWTRYVAGVTPASRFVFDNRTFNFQSVVNVDELSEWLMIVAKEVV